MTKMYPYLNFDGKAEEAFNFYRTVFGGDFIGEIYRMKGTPGSEQLSEEEQNRVMHIALPVGDGMLMASDILPSAGHTLQMGNNNYISLHPENKEEADYYFKGLSEGGKIEMPMSDTFWGAYFGSFEDKYGVHWMINCDLEQAQQSGT